MIRTGIFALIVLLPNFIWASTASVRLLSERHRTEWNWVENPYGILQVLFPPYKKGE